MFVGAAGGNEDGAAVGVDLPPLPPCLDVVREEVTRVECGTNEDASVKLGMAWVMMVDDATAPEPNEREGRIADETPVPVGKRTVLLEPPKDGNMAVAVGTPVLPWLGKPTVDEILEMGPPGFTAVKTAFGVELEIVGARE